MGKKKYGIKRKGRRYYVYAGTKSGALEKFRGQYSWAEKRTIKSIRVVGMD